MTNTVTFVVGNAYKRIPLSQAPLDRSGRTKKIHDNTIFVDVVNGEVDLIERVEFHFGRSFRPQAFYHYSPIKSPIRGWRFCSRQQTFGIVPCTIKIVGSGGSIRTIKYQLMSRSTQEAPQEFVEETSFYKAQLGPVPFPSDRTFGVELELTSASYHSPDQVAALVESHSGRNVQARLDSYAEARADHSSWKLMRDSSIACHINRPDCNAFELVSPILQSSQGLEECQAIVKGLKKVRTIRVNKSMGFHVHVSVKDAEVSDLVKICQNFIKYEQAMDAFMPPSRSLQNQFCRSNRDAVPGATNKQKHKNLGRCCSLTQLVATMNPGESRYYKLNLMNLYTGRQPTVEFRQHSSTVSQEKVLNWVRFCVMLVSNSIRLKSPSALKQSRTLDEQMDMLFQYAIKDRYLAKFYKGRREELMDAHEAARNENGSCCEPCAQGQGCQQHGKIVP